MGFLVTNIPKKTILRAVMGNGTYKVSKSKVSFDQPRIKETYYQTSGRLSRAQILVLLEMHRHVDGEGYAYEVRTRTLAKATHLSMQCVNRCIQVLQARSFIVIGIKEYGYLNYFIDITQGYSKENNSGGYYQMDNGLLEEILQIDRVDTLRCTLVGLLEDDFARKKGEQAFLPQSSIRRIMPSSAHPKARQTVLSSEDSRPYRFIEKRDGVAFILESRFYGKLTSSKAVAEGEVLLSDLRGRGVPLSDEGKADIIALCQEYGASEVRLAIDFMEPEAIKKALPLGAVLRLSIEKNKTQAAS